MNPRTSGGLQLKPITQTPMIAARFMFVPIRWSWSTPDSKKTSLEVELPCFANMPAVAEQPPFATSGAKALKETKGFIAALKALRHPKSSFSANCKALSSTGLWRQG
jgi:hypothetical protein